MEESHCPEEWPDQNDGSDVDTFFRNTTDIHQIEAVAVLLREMMGTSAGEFLLPAFHPNPPRSRQRSSQSVPPNDDGLKGGFIYLLRQWLLLGFFIVSRELSDIYKTNIRSITYFDCPPRLWNPSRSIICAM